MGMGIVYYVLCQAESEVITQLAQFNQFTHTPNLCFGYMDIFQISSIPYERIALVSGSEIAI